MGKVTFGAFFAWNRERVLDYDVGNSILEFSFYPLRDRKPIILFHFCLLNADR